MRIPNRIIEHPVEALLAGVLLLVLLFGSSDFGGTSGTGKGAAPAQIAQRL